MSRVSGLADVWGFYVNGRALAAQTTRVSTQLYTPELGATKAKPQELETAMTSIPAPETLSRQQKSWSRILCGPAMSKPAS